ncbi:MAG: exosortase/archaeosortase family protein [Candidatus Diapherotrites archaeon]|nr:exosortase/archaeosortase family protein [Candidatus Diapherotrites archaeon]
MQITEQQIKTEIKKSIIFLSGFALFFIVLSLVISLIPLQFLEWPTAWFTQQFLSFIGKPTVLTFQEPILLSTETTEIAISYLCTGFLELIVLVSAILASHGIEWNKRIKGIVFAVIGTQIFNLIRIFATVLFIFNSDIQTIDLVHNVLFRLTLFIVIAGFYFIWFAWSIGKLKFAFHRKFA